MPYEKSSSRGVIAETLGARCGYKVQAYQSDLLRDFGARTKDGRYYLHPTIGASIPRQSGKSVSGIVWALYRAIAEGARVLWTDHNYSTTCEMYRRFRRILGTKPNDPLAEFPEFNARLKSTSAKTAQEAFFLKAPYDGAPEGGIHFATRTKSAALGFAFDMVIFDEAQELTDEQEQAILPTTTSGALHDLQLIYLGTPTRPTSQGTKFRELRDQALAQDRDLCWWEWGVDEIGDVHDETRWEKVNPALGEVADVRAIRTGAKRLSDFAFAQEYLGYWTDVTRTNALIERDLWEACKSCDRVLDDASAFGVKFSADGQTVAVAVAINQSNTVRIELVGCKSTQFGTQRLVDAIVSKCSLSSNKNAPCVLVDGKSGAASFVGRVMQRDESVNIRCAKTQDAIVAAQEFLNALKERTLTWYKPKDAPSGDDRLTESVLSVTKRNIGSQGGWGFGGEDATPTEACALALWAAKNKRQQQEEVAVFLG